MFFNRASNREVMANASSRFSFSKFTKERVPLPEYLIDHVKVMQTQRVGEQGYRVEKKLRGAIWLDSDCLIGKKCLKIMQMSQSVSS
jgi:hypothetical protein